MSVQSADLSSTHKYPWKWYLSDLDKIEKHGRTVFSCFSCGGAAQWAIKSQDIR